MEFAGSREVLNGKANSLREKGKGKMKRKADSISDEEAMWESGVLGHSSPKSLNQTIFFLPRTPSNKHGRFKNSFKSHDWRSGICITKTRQGGLIKQQPCVPQRMFAVGGPKCPIVTYITKNHCINHQAWYRGW